MKNTSKITKTDFFIVYNSLKNNATDFKSAALYDCI